MVFAALIAGLLATSPPQSAPGIHGLRPGETAQLFGEGTSVGNAVVGTSDGGLAAVGYTTGGGSGAEDVLVVRTDAAGRSLWTRTLGGPSDDDGWAIASGPNGGFIVVGYTASFGSDGEDILAIGLDRSGKTLWTRTIGGPGNQRAWAMVPVAGGFAIAGQTDHGPGGGWDALVVKIDATGKELWSRAFGGAGIDRLFGIAVTTDGGVVVTGSRSQVDGAPLGILAARLDAGGHVVWDRRFGGDRESLGHAVIALKHGGYLVTGYGRTAAGDNDIVISKVDDKGNVTWQKTRGGGDDERGMMSVELPAGGFASVGYRRTTTADWEIWLGRWRADGTPDGERLLGSNGPDRGVMLTRTRDGLALIGQLGNAFDNTSRLLLARLDGEFVLVGGYAPALHGAPRYTGDLDPSDTRECGQADSAGVI